MPQPEILSSSGASRATPGTRFLVCRTAPCFPPLVSYLWFRHSRPWLLGRLVFVAEPSGDQRRGTLSKQTRDRDTWREKRRRTRKISHDAEQAHDAANYHAGDRSKGGSANRSEAAAAKSEEREATAAAQ